ncbi:glycosyltransferase [Paraburkholderia sp.]|uniref:glycosyltransferase n=1 Tax=Paraburkholderia sp. TaxID=1926495 RepID=UPI002D6551CC|nr:glycosyltransferase [Paraburkholderia sp.]HZZ05690.1 glycosyltransferase [Paraburkholderia sp.]
MTARALLRRPPRISCVICAYNEAPRICAVLAVACAHPLLDEIIVVDDGSTHGTAEVVEGEVFPANLADLPEFRKTLRHALQLLHKNGARGAIAASQ